MLTTSDPVQFKAHKDGKKSKVVSGSMQWTADVPVWDSNVIRIVHAYRAYKAIASGLHVEIESFSIKYQPSARGIKRRTPQLPPLVRFDDPSLNSFLNKPGSSSTEDSLESEDTSQSVSVAADSWPFPMFLHILGGADILRNAKLYMAPQHSSVSSHLWS